MLHRSRLYWCSPTARYFIWSRCSLTRFSYLTSLVLPENVYLSLGRYLFIAECSKEHLLARSSVFRLTKRERERERETLDFPERISIPREFAVDVKIVIKRNDNDRGPPRGRSLAESFRFEPNKTALNEFSLALGSPFSSLVFSSFYPWRISRLINI